MRPLPRYQGYAVDLLMGCFLKLEWGTEPTYIPFTSEQGGKLLNAWVTEREQDYLREVTYYERLYFGA